MKTIVIFSSGAGSNAENVVTYFQKHPQIRVKALFSNKKNAEVLEKLEPYDISSFVFNRVAFYRSGYVLKLLQQINPDLIVLAGFLWKVPEIITQVFTKKIINLHPSLLPKYGGKGMYGYKVHREVLKNKEPISGITIHYVNKYYDQGDIIFQVKVAVSKNDTIKSLAHKIHQLEHKHLPMQIETLLC